MLTFAHGSKKNNTKNNANDEQSSRELTIVNKSIADKTELPADAGFRSIEYLVTTKAIIGERIHPRSHVSARRCRTN